MKKGLLVVFVFCLITAVAIVYAIQQPKSGKQFQSVAQNLTHHSVSKGNLEFEWKLGNPYLLQNSNGEVSLDLRIKAKTL